MKVLGMLAALFATMLLAVSPTGAQDAASEMDAVKRVVESTSTFGNAEKLDELLALYADDAKIDSKAAGAQVSKDQYREAVKRVWAQRTVNRVDVGSLRVTMTDATHAIAEGVVYIHLTSGGRTGGKNQWKLEKRDGRWLIVETKYQ